MTNKQKYIEFCKTEKDIPVFSKDWWLDTVCGENNWDVSIVEKGGQVVASLPYYNKHKAILNIITMPKLTQTMGPYIKYPKGQKYYKRLSWEKDMINKLISQLPKVDYFIQNFNHAITNWLPFYWHGYEQTSKYTYIIDNITIEDLESNLEGNRRKNIRKALDLGIKVVEGNDIQKFYELNKKTFIRQNMTIPYSFEYVNRLYNTCNNNNACKIFFAQDSENNIIATNFLVYDDNTVYYIMGGIDPDKKDLGGMDLVQLEGIKFALKSGKIFDFEGSMIESIEKYFRSFGSRQKQYCQITKTNSKLLKIQKFLTDFKK